VLSGGRGAGGRAGKKLFVGNERNGSRRFGPLHEGGREHTSAQRGWDTEVRYLANLASAVALAVRVNVAGGNNDKENGQQAGRECQEAQCAAIAETIVRSPAQS